MDESILSEVKRNVLSRSEDTANSDHSCKVTVEGYNFSHGVDYSSLFKSYMSTGFQATNLAVAIEIVREMVR